jgi:hypothetical protein
MPRLTDFGEERHSAIHPDSFVIMAIHIIL